MRWPLLAIVPLLVASAANAQPRCKGDKRFYAGKCRYPEEIDKLRPPPPPPPPRPTAEPDTPPVSDGPGDVGACGLARAVDTVEVWRGYLAAYPNGGCQDEALARIAKLALPPPPPPPPPAVEPAAPGPLLWIGVGVAGAGLLGLAVTGGVALARAGELDRACPGGDCPANQREALEEATTIAHLATVELVIGLAGAGLGIYGLIDWKTSATTHASAGPGWLGLSGTF